MENDDGACPINRSSQQQANHQRAWEVSFRIFEFRRQVSKRFEANKTPEHHRQRGEQTGEFNIANCREGDFDWFQIARPPDSNNEGNNQSGNDRLQISA